MLALNHIRSCMPTANPVLFLLTHLLTIEGVESIDPDLPIETLFPDGFIWIAVFVELAYGLDIPDEMIADPKISLRQIAEEIQKLPHIDSETYGKKLLQAQMLLRAAMEN
jgi:hypothetical protein